MKKKQKESVTVSDFGAAGAPIDRRHPFYFGFVATIGALTAFVLMRALASASQVFVLILVALFLATGLNPAVEAIRRRGLSRTGAVTIISALIGTSLLGLVGGLLAVPIAASVILILEEVVFPRAEKS